MLRKPLFFPVSSTQPSSSKATLHRKKMGNTDTNETARTTKPCSEYRLSELKAFDETKAGVKGLVDAGVKKIPSLFHHHPDKYEKASNIGNTCHVIPVIDLAAIDKDPSIRHELVEIIREASETWGFFQVVNHGIPVSVLKEIKDGVQRFFDQETEVKKEFYTRDHSRLFVYNSNFDLYSTPALNWRDTFICYLAPNTPKSEDLPAVCRYVCVSLYVFLQHRLLRSRYSGLKTYICLNEILC